MNIEPFNCYCGNTTFIVSETGKMIMCFRCKRAYSTNELTYVLSKKDLVTN